MPLIVVKVGTSTLMKVSEEGEEQRVNLANMGALVDAITRLHKKGFGVIIVTSAAVGFGCLKLKISKRPESLALKQAVAAAGQSHLIRMYEDLFGVYGVHVAQILLSRFDFASKDRFSNVLSAIRQLLALNVIPIINENDTVSTEELRFGDNDTLSALVAVGVGANRLFLLTDVDSLFTANPRVFSDAKPVLDVTPSELATIGGADASGSSGWGTGGMTTKIISARTAVCAGIPVVLSHGAFPDRMLEYLKFLENPIQHKRPACTVFHAAEPVVASTMNPHRRWLLALPVRGRVLLDSGACKAITGHKSSLFAAGVKHVNGKFFRDECVSLVSEESGSEIARGLMNLDSDEVEKIKGLQSHELERVLGFATSPELIYRSNICILSASCD